MTAQTEIGSLLRELAPQVAGRLVRRYGDFDNCEDAVQEALLSAAQQWTVDGVPENPRGWLVTVASRRLIEMMRSDAARRRRELTAALLEVEGEAGPLTVALSVLQARGGGDDPVEVGARRTPDSDKAPGQRCCSRVGVIREATADLRRSVSRATSWQISDRSLKLKAAA